MNEIKRQGIQGWKQFLSGRQRMLAEFDRAKTQSESRKVKTHHGNVAEAQFRDWLSSFLPKQFGVTSGYIVSQGVHDNVPLPHYDVIIYDQIASPILWCEDYPDRSTGGSSRAIPAEHVRSVIEVKSTFKYRTVVQAVDHLSQLRVLFPKKDRCDIDNYQDCLSREFSCGIVFFELRTEDRSDFRSLEYLSDVDLFKFFGCHILRGEGLPEHASGRTMATEGETPVERIPPDGSLLSGFACSKTKLAPNGKYRGSVISWHEANFSMFAFDVIALLQGTYKLGQLSSFHGMSWVDHG